MSRKERWDIICNGYLLIRTSKKHEHEVYNYLLKDEGIIEIKPLFNDEQYDMIAKIEADSMENLLSYVSEKISSHSGVLNARLFT
jgi:hypothetical protein